VGGFLLKGGINAVGGTALMGDGASNTIRYTVINADGDILQVDKDSISKLDDEGNEVRVYDTKQF
jgi:hypothetical protein